MSRARQMAQEAVPHLMCWGADDKFKLWPQSKRKPPLDMKACRNVATLGEHPSDFKGQSELKESRVGPGTSLQLSDREEKWMCLGSSINSTWETRKGRA